MEIDMISSLSWELNTVVAYDFLYEFMVILPCSIDKDNCIQNAETILKVVLGGKFVLKRNYLYNLILFM